MNAALDSNTENGQRAEFLRISGLVVSFFQKYGITAVACHSSELPHFFALSADSRRQVLALLQTFYTCLEASESSGDSFLNAKRSLWHALRQLKLAPPSELLSHVEDESIIEIYDPIGLQLWRNLECMKFCSYTLEEIYCLEWTRRYERDPAINQACLEAVRDVITGVAPEIYFPPMPVHEMAEISSTERLVYSIHHDVLAPLRGQTGTVEAWLVISTAKILGSRAADLANVTPIRRLPRAEPAPLPPSAP